MRRTHVLAIIVAALFAVTLVLDIALARGTLVGADYDIGSLVVLIPFAIVGVVVAWKRPGNPLGWIFLAIATSVAFGGFCIAYAYRSVILGGDWPLDAIAVWISGWFFIIPMGLLSTFPFLLFPDGAAPSRRWRVVGWLCVLAIALNFVGVAFLPGTLEDSNLPGVENPFAIQALEDNFLFEIGWPLLGICFVASVASLVFRFRRASGTERQQLKWFVYAAALDVVLFVLGSVTGTGDNDILFFAGISLIPLAMGIAILRYRLYDIDVIVNRTLVYGALTAILAGVYLGVVFLLQGIVAGFGAGSDLVVAASTLAVAALFSPLRRRVQAFIDHYFYRRKYDAAHTLAAFTSRLRQEVDLDQLTSELVDVVQRTMQPAHVSVWLRTEVGR